MRRKGLLAAEPSRFAMFEVAIVKRGRSRWEWRVCDRAGKVIMRGWEISRSASKYRSDRALFQLLLVCGTNPREKLQTLRYGRATRADWKISLTTANDGNFLTSLENFFGQFFETKMVPHHTKCLMLEVALTKRGRVRWEWRVVGPSGKTIMGGWENSRSEAKYQGERALFLLLMTGRILGPLQPS